MKYEAGKDFILILKWNCEIIFSFCWMLSNYYFQNSSIISVVCEVIIDYPYIVIIELSKRAVIFCFHFSKSIYREQRGIYRQFQLYAVTAGSSRHSTLISVAVISNNNTHEFVSYTLRYFVVAPWYFLYSHPLYLQENAHLFSPSVMQAFCCLDPLRSTLL